MLSSNNKRRNYRDDVLLEIISEFPLLQKNIEVAMFLRDPNNKISVTPELLNDVNNKPVEVLERLEKFIKNVTAKYFEDELYFDTEIYKEEGFSLRFDFRESKYKHFYEDVSTMHDTNLHLVMQTAVCNRYEIYFKELYSFIQRFVDDLMMKGKEADFDFDFQKNFPRLYFTLPENSGNEVDDMEVHQSNVIYYSPYDIFSEEVGPRVQKTYPNASFEEMNRIIRQGWDNMSDSQKQRYDDLFLEYKLQIEQQVKPRKTPYDFFAEIIYHQVKQNYPNASNEKVNQIIGQQWDSMSEGQKRPYEDMYLEYQRQIGM